MTGYSNKLNKNKNTNKSTITMSFKIKDKKLLKNHNKIWKKLEKLMSINFNCKAVYGNDDKSIKKTYEDSATTNFHNTKEF